MSDTNSDGSNGKLEGKLRIGVSSCLLGDEVRYDGGHKHNDFVATTLGEHAEFVRVCPEVEVGMGTPREAIHLVKLRTGVALVGIKSDIDWTERMNVFARRRAEELAALDLDGYVFKKDSPSCGVFRVRVHSAVEGVQPTRLGRGLFAGAVIERMPLLPVEEEGRLFDAALREAFIERVFAWRRLRRCFAPRWTMGDLVSFQSDEKMLLLAHDAVAARKLGALVAGAKAMPREELRTAYIEGYMGALAKPATTRRHVNVLDHMAGHFKKLLDGKTKAALHDVIADYAAGLVPLIVPVTLIAHYTRVLEVQWLARQSYLHPHPKEMMLRNHV